MVGVATAFLIALAWSIGSIWIGPKVGLVDMPGASSLKIHRRPIPLLGGIGVFAGIHIGLFVEGVFDPVLFVATLAVLIVGLIDDATMLSPKIRLASEFAASVFLVVLIDTGTVSIPWIIAGIGLVIIAINAVNLLDGMDGLVASVTIVSGLGLAWAGATLGGESALGLVVAAAAAGFVILNWQPAKVFLGDNGAYVIGMVLAYGVLVGGDGATITTSLLVVGVLGVFLIDLVATILRRLHNRTPIFEGDRSHIYDQLADRGWPVPAIAALAASTQAVLAVIAVNLLP